MDKRLWVVIVLAVVLTLLMYRRRVSGFTPPQGQPISMMDLQEFSYLSIEQKNTYNNLLTQNSKSLQSAAVGRNFNMYKQTLDKILRDAILTPPSTKPPGSNVCSGVILMGDCLNMQTCSPEFNTITKNNQKYCVCLDSTKVIVVGPGGIAMCQPGPCPARTVTEQITGQKMCQPNCPPERQGYPCV